MAFGIKRQQSHFSVRHGKENDTGTGNRNSENSMIYVDADHDDG